MIKLCKNDPFYLKGSDSEVKEDFVIYHGFIERHKDNIMDAKQRDQQESGFGQPPENTHNITEILYAGDLETTHVYSIIYCLI